MNAILLLAALAFADAPADAGSTAPRAVISGELEIEVGEIAEISALKSVNAKTYRIELNPTPKSVKRPLGEGNDSLLYIGHNADETFELQLIVASPDGRLDVQYALLKVGKGGQAAPEGSGAPAGAGAGTVAPPAAGLSMGDFLTAMRQFKELQELMAPAAPPLRAAAPPLYAQQHPLTTLEMMGRPAPEPGEGVTWPQGVKLLADRVASGNRSADGRIVAGSFRATANRIKTGLLAGDPWDEACKGARLALGKNYAPWAPFFSEAGQLVGGLRQQGAMQNPEQAIDVLESAAAVLGGLQ